MKLAFSTLGMSGLRLGGHLLHGKKDFGFCGIEMRGLGDEIFSVNAKPFRKDNLPKTIEQLHKSISKSAAFLPAAR